MARLPIKSLSEKEGIAAMFFLAFCLALALVFPAGVGTSNQAPSVSHAVAPWIFGPFQILLLYLPSRIGALLVPFLIIAGISGLPWLDNILGARWGLRIFLTFFTFVVILLLWFLVKELWWT